MLITQCPFKDKLIAFIGTPTRCTREEAKYEIVDVGGIYTDLITSSVDYVVAFDGAEKTTKFKMVESLANKWSLIIINEDELFDML